MTLRFEELIYLENLNLILPKCKLCENEVWDIHSDYCQYHSRELIIQSNKIIAKKHANLTKNKELPHFLSDDIQVDFTIQQKNISDCIKCGNEAYGYPYCKNCYNEQKNFIKNNDKKHQIQNNKNYDYLKIDNHTNINLKEKKYDGYNLNDFNNWKKPYDYENSNEKNKKTRKYISKDGKTFKSKSERTIYEFLQDHNIRCEYEKEFECSDGNIVRPDFYIKGPCFLDFRIIKDVYIEHWGRLNHENPFQRRKYEMEMNYKIQEYKKAGITLISTYESDMDNYSESLKRKLKEYKKGQINY